jgi:hypothetical protein
MRQRKLNKVEKEFSKLEVIAPCYELVLVGRALQSTRF